MRVRRPPRRSPRGSTAHRHLRGEARRSAVIGARTQGRALKIWLSRAGALMTRERGEIDRFDLGLVPRESGPQRGWQRSAALYPNG